MRAVRTLPALFDEGRSFASSRRRFPVERYISRSDIRVRKGRVFVLGDLIGYIKRVHIRRTGLPVYRGGKHVGWGGTREDAAWELALIDSLGGGTITQPTVLEAVHSAITSAVDRER